MIKKKLGLLAGSLLAATSSQAAITFTGDTLAVFSTAGQGTYYQLIAGSTGDTLRDGRGFVINVSAAASALGGSIDLFAILALSSGTTSYNYTEFLYVELGGGLVYSGDPNASSNQAALNQIYDLESFLQNADLGLNEEGSLGDFDSSAAVADLLLSASLPTNLIISEQTLGGSIIPKHIILTRPASPGGVGLSGNTLVATGFPIPAAAWLFGSALISLGVAKRKSQR